MGIWNADKLALKDSNGVLQEFAESVFAAALTVAAGLTATYTELNKLAGVVAGTVTASKALVVDANKDLSALRNLVLTNLDAGASGTAGTVDIFPTTAAKGKTQFTAADNSGDTTTTITTAAQSGARTYTVPDAGASAANFLLTSGAATLLTSTTTQLNQITDAFGTVNFHRGLKCARVALAAVDSGGGILSWQNPEAGAILVERILLDVTTQSSGACTADFGMTATNGTTSADNLIDDLSLATAGLYDNFEDQGTNGTSRQKVAAGKWVTGSVASGASSGLVGFAYIFYVNL